MADSNSRSLSRGIALFISATVKPCSRRPSAWSFIRADERRDDDRGALQLQRGQLVAEAFARAGRHDDEHVATGDGGMDGLGLSGRKRLNPKCCSSFACKSWSGNTAMGQPLVRRRAAKEGLPGTDPMSLLLPVPAAPAKRVMSASAVHIRGDSEARGKLVEVGQHFLVVMRPARWSGTSCRYMIHPNPAGGGRQSFSFAMRVAIWVHSNSKRCAHGGHATQQLA